MRSRSPKSDPLTQRSGNSSQVCTVKRYRSASVALTGVPKRRSSHVISSRSPPSRTKNPSFLVHSPYASKRSGSERSIASSSGSVGT